MSLVNFWNATVTIESGNPSINDIHIAIWHLEAIIRSQNPVVSKKVAEEWIEKAFKKKIQLLARQIENHACLSFLILNS